jgi:hypothetical protein
MMNNNILTKIVQFVKDNSKDIILAVIVFLISLLSFAAGYLIAYHQQSGENIRIMAPTGNN